MWFNRKGQAATEFAVLGSLIIVAFAFLISYSEKLNRQQAYIQQTFRAALKEAKSTENPAKMAAGTAAYLKVAFRRMPNVGSPMELGQLQSFSNSANVLWSNKNVSEGVSKYQFNEDTAIDIPLRAAPVNTTEFSRNKFTNTTDATTTLVKTEKGGDISTIKTLIATDKLTANVTVGGAPLSTINQSLGEEPYKAPDGKIYFLGGKYYSSGGGGLRRVRSMQ